MTVGGQCKEINVEWKLHVVQIISADMLCIKCSALHSKSRNVSRAHTKGLYENFVKRNPIRPVSRYCC